MRILDKNLVFEGRLLHVRCDRLADDQGRETTREFVVHPGGVSIIARPTPGEIVFVRQYRYPTGDNLLELPAGTLEAGEAPADTARRELEEETGYRAEEMTLLASYYTTPGFTNELMYLYEASGLTPGDPRPEDDESIEVVHLPTQRVREMLANREFRDAKTLVGLLMVLPPAGSAKSS